MVNVIYCSDNQAFLNVTQMSKSGATVYKTVAHTIN